MGMIACPVCSNQFSVNYDVCPLCREYLVTPQQRVEAMRENVADWMATPETREYFSRSLIDAGHPSVEVDELVRVTLGKIRRDNRSAGLSRCLLAAFVAGLGVIVIPLGLIQIGIVFIGISIFPAISGITALLTGKD